ncbi:MAG: DUF3631 domain-containing protein [Acidimicrobiales bacterium]
MSGYGSALFPQHQKLLVASAIDPEVAAERGYVSVDQKTRLARLGFSPAQQRVPGLLVPIHGTAGGVVAHQYRPDDPRTTKAGKVVKYETPSGSRLVLDVPPRVRPLLGDPAVDLWVTEGARKADAAASAGLACLSLSGVWAWRGTNGDGGKTALADWHDVALNGRVVHVCFDSDVMTKDGVRAALAAFKDYLGHRDAKVRLVYLPADDDKVGLDDYLAAGGTVDDLLAASTYELREPEPQRDEEAEAVVEELAGLEGPPADEPGWALLDAVATFLERYVVFPTPLARDAVALWALHTHAFDACEVTPYLHIGAPEKRCGKSRLKDVLRVLVARPWSVVTPTEAVVFRKLSAEHPTLLLDEVDAIFAKDSPHEGLRAILNAGYEVGNPVPRCVGQGHNLVDFDVFSPKALVGIGELPTTVSDRCIAIRMKRRARGERVGSFRRKTAATLGRPLNARLASWADRHVESLTEAEPSLPAVLDDRAADCWEPLVAIADAAGGNWPSRARAAAVALSADGRLDEETVSVRLLADVREVWPEGEHVASTLLAERLVALEEGPWAEWYGHPLSTNKLARLLAPYDIRPKQIRVGESKIRGYEKDAFLDAWERYLTPSQEAETASDPPATRFQPVQPVHRRSEVVLQPVQPPGVEDPKTCPDQPCTGVPVEKGDRGGTDEVPDDEGKSAAGLARLLDAFPGSTVVDLPEDLVDLPLDEVGACRVCAGATVTADDEGVICSTCHAERWAS